MYVSGIDSVSLSDGRRIAKFSNSLIYGSPYWLFGIGSPSGFLSGEYFTIFHCGPGPSTEGEYMLCYDNPSNSYHFQYTTDILYGNFESNCFDFNTLEVSSLSTNTIDLAFYPDPIINDEINFKGAGADDVIAIEVVGMMGKAVAHFSQPRKEQPLQLRLPTGVYMVRAFFVDGSVITRRVIKL
jgi:hypothetical protein